MQSLVEHSIVIHFFPWSLDARSNREILKVHCARHDVLRDHILQLFEFIFDFYFPMARTSVPSVSPAARINISCLTTFAKMCTSLFVKNRNSRSLMLCKRWFMYACTFNVMQVVPFVIRRDEQIKISWINYFIRILMDYCSISADGSCSLCH